MVNTGSRLAEDEALLVPARPYRARAAAMGCVWDTRAGRIAAVVVIALASGVVLAGLSHELESRCSLVWSPESGPAWLLKASPQ